MKIKSLKRNPLRQLGQGMTEYIIIVGVIAVSAIGVFGYFGDTIQEQTAGLATEIAGGDANTQIEAAATAAGSAATAADNHKNLGNYNENSQGNE